MKKKIAQLSQSEIHYHEFGTGSPLLILHGWGSSSQVMLPLAQALSDNHTCFVVDFPGFGSSPVPNSAWSVGDYADSIKEFVEKIIGSKSDVLVHSFGGRVILKILATEWSKSFINKVLITGGAGMKPKRSLRFYYRKYLAKTLKLPFQLLPEPLKSNGLNKMRETDLWKSLGSSDYKQLQGVLREVFVKTVSEYLESCLPKIQHEVFLLWGKNDEATPWYQAERIQKGIKKSSLVGIEDAGHYAFIDKPSAFISIAKAYLNA